MNANVKAAIRNACLSPEEFKAYLATVSAPGQPAKASDREDVAQPAAARAEGHSAGVRQAEMNAYQQGRAAAQALLDIAIAAPAEMAKYQAGASAARDVLNKVAGAPDEMGKYAAGAVAARALLGKTATTLEAK
jgi:hypothetical protein